MSLSAIDIAVLVAAVLLLAVLGFMLRPPRGRRFSPPPPDAQDVFIDVSEPMVVPAVVVLKRRLPAKLRVHRDGGSEEMLISGLAAHRKLPDHKTTTIDVTGGESGVHEVRSGEQVRGLVVIVP